MLFYDKLKKNSKSESPTNRRHLTLDRRTAGKASNSNIQQCIEQEMARYFELLDGQAPHDLYRMVMGQVECALIQIVMEECGNNQSKAAEYLGISRGTLRNKLTEQGLI